MLESNGALDAGPRSQAFGELRAAMEVRVGQDGGINGGNEGSDWVKYMSEWRRNEDYATTEHHSQAWTTERGSRHSEYGDDPFAQWVCVWLTPQPAALFDGLKDDSVASSWGKDDWEKWLA